MREMTPKTEMQHSKLPAREKKNAARERAQVHHNWACKPRGRISVPLCHITPLTQIQ